MKALYILLVVATLAVVVAPEHSFAQTTHQQQIDDGMTPEEDRIAHFYVGVIAILFACGAIIWGLIEFGLREWKFGIGLFVVALVLCGISIVNFAVSLFNAVLMS